MANKPASKSTAPKSVTTNSTGKEIYKKYLGYMFSEAQLALMTPAHRAQLVAKLVKQDKETEREGKAFIKRERRKWVGMQAAATAAVNAFVVYCLDPTSDERARVEAKNDLTEVFRKAGLLDLYRQEDGTYAI